MLDVTPIFSNFPLLDHTDKIHQTEYPAKCVYFVVGRVFSECIERASGHFLDVLRTLYGQPRKNFYEGKNSRKCTYNPCDRSRGFINEAGGMDLSATDLAANDPLGILLIIGTNIFGVYCLYKIIQVGYWFLKDRSSKDEF